MPAEPTRLGGPACAGFSLVEVMMGLSMLAVSLLAYASSSVSHFRLSREEIRRTTVLQVTRDFTERLRADDDWSNLYATLRERAAEADGTLAAAVRLDGGQWARPLSDYYADIDIPPALSAMRVRVEVPESLPVGAEAGSSARVLREDASLPAFGLPGDLNGDGIVDAQARDADYVALPVVLTFRWQAQDGSARELRRLTWLGGNR